MKDALLRMKSNANLKLAARKLRNSHGDMARFSARVLYVYALLGTDLTGFHSRQFAMTPLSKFGKGTIIKKSSKYIRNLHYFGRWSS
jgi:hypothetical protein